MVGLGVRVEEALEGVRQRAEGLRRVRVAAFVGMHAPRALAVAPPHQPCVVGERHGQAQPLVVRRRPQHGLHHRRAAARRVLLRGRPHGIRG